MATGRSFKMENTRGKDDFSNIKWNHLINWLIDWLYERVEPELFDWLLDWRMIQSQMLRRIDWLIG